MGDDPVRQIDDAHAVGDDVDHPCFRIGSRSHRDRIYAHRHAHDEDGLCLGGGNIEDLKRVVRRIDRQ